MSNYWDNFEAPDNGNKRSKKQDRNLVENKKESSSNRPRRYAKNTLLKKADIWSDDSESGVDLYSKKTKKKAAPKKGKKNEAEESVERIVYTAVPFSELVATKKSKVEERRPVVTTESELDPVQRVSDSEGEGPRAPTVGIINNPEGPQEEIVPYEEEEEDDKCFFCNYYSRSHEVEEEGLVEIRLMLMMIECMFGKNNIRIEQIGESVEDFYYDKIYLPHYRRNRNTKIPIVKKRHVVEHYRDHLNINPTIYLYNTFQELDILRSELRDIMFYQNPQNPNGPKVASDKNITLYLKVTDMMNRVHKSDPSESPFYPGDALAYTLKEKGLFLNSGVSVTEEHKQVMNKWKEEDYKPLY